jgi:plasmid replication initiation protein
MLANFFSLGKKRRHQPISYKFNNGEHLKVYTTHDLGIATIYDLDILLYAISQLVKAHDSGLEVSNRLYFTGGDFLAFTGRNTKSGKRADGGDAYNKIYQKLTRLHNTHIETSINNKSGARDWSFNLLSDIKQATDEQGRHRGYEITLPEFLVTAIKNNKNVLTLDDGYFSLTGGLERFLYLHFRKAAGSGQQFYESYESLYKKSGSLESPRAFKSRVKKVIQKHGGNLLGYDLALTFNKRGDTGITAQKTERLTVKDQAGD